MFSSLRSFREERHGVHLHTLVCVWGALVEAYELAREFEDPVRVERYEKAVNEIRTAARTFFPLLEKGWLPRMRHVSKGEIIPMNEDDLNLDAASAVLFQIGFPPG